MTPPARNRWVIHPYRRVYWDIFVFAVIIASAFEVPYDWLVGWHDETLTLVFDLSFTLVFGLDILLNLITMRERSFSGSWGWRVVVGLFDSRRSPEGARRRALEDNPDLPLVLDAPGSIWRDYVRSAWFVVDVLSTIPWGVLAASFSPLTSLRLLRLLRLGRLFRVLRLTKAVHMLERIRRAVPAVPSVERLISIAVSLPWLAHLMACFTYYFEHAHGGRDITYGGAYHAMWMAIIARQTVLGGGVTTATFLLTMFGVLVSVFVLASVTGNLAALYTSIDLGKRENGQIVLENHTIVIGWNNNIFSVVRQLITAADAETGRSKDIVLLSHLSEAEVLREFHEFGLEFDPRRLTVHTGSIHAVQNIRKLSVGRAANVILLGGSALEARLSERESFRRSDTDVLKVLLACCAAFGSDQWVRASRRRRAQLSIVAAVHSRATAALLKDGVPVGERDRDLLEIHLVDTEDLLARCVAMVAADSRFAQLFRELFSYTFTGGGGGHSTEVYIVEFEDLNGDPARPGVFDSFLDAMPEAIPIGFYARSEIVPAQHGASYPAGSFSVGGTGDRTLFLNPGFRSDKSGCLIEAGFEAEHCIGPGDALVVLAPNRAAARVVRYPAPGPPCAAPAPVKLAPREPQQLAVLGDGNKVTRVVELMFDHLPRDSNVVVNAPVSVSDEGLEVAARRGISLLAGAARTQRSPEEDTAYLRSCDTVVVLSNSANRHHHDADILMSLTAIGARAKRAGATRRTHVIELLDAHNIELADAFGDVASLISPELVSNYLVQIALHPERGRVYAELLDIEGNEFYIVPLERYLRHAGEQASFATMSRRARAAGEIAVGYAFAADGADALRLCPREGRRTFPRDEVESRWSERMTSLVVLAGCHPDARESATG